MITSNSPASSRMSASRGRVDKLGDDKDGASSTRSRSASRGALRHGDLSESGFGTERQSLLHCLSDTNRTVTKLMFDKDKLSERLSRAQAEATKELSGLRLKLDAATHEGNSLRAALREKTVEYDAVQTAMYDAKNELADVKSSSALRISELEAANREQQSQLQDLQRDLEEYRRRLQSKNQDIYAREQELIKERELHEAKALRLQQQADRAQRSLKHNKASRELEDQLQTALTNIEALKRTIRSLQEEVCELRAEAATKRTSTSNRLKEIQAENASLKAQLEYHTANARWTSDDINHLQSELAAKTSQLQALQTDLHETQADLKFLQDAGDSEIQRQVAALEARLTANPSNMKMVSELKSEVTELRAALSKAQRTSTELQSVVESYHADLEALTGEAQRLVTTVASQDGTILEYQRRVQELENLSATHSETVDSHVRRATASLREDIRKKDEELAQTFALATDLNKQRENLVELVRELTASEEKHASTVSQLSSAVTTLRAEHEAVKSERAALLSERHDHLKRLQEVSAERETHAKLLEALTSRLHVTTPVVSGTSGRVTVSRQSSATFAEPQYDDASVSSRHTPMPAHPRRKSSPSVRGTSPARFSVRDDNPPSDPAHDALLARAKAVVRACN